MSHIGFITVQSHPTAIIRLNGDDISRRCFAADDIQGFADVYKLNPDGRKYSVEGADGKRTLATERLMGLVEIEV